MGTMRLTILSALALSAVLVASAQSLNTNLIVNPGGDVTGDGCIDDADLLQVLFAFGSTGSNPADVNGDGIVDDADLLIVLFGFGSGC